MYRRKLTVQTVISTLCSVEALKNREGIDRLKGLSCLLHYFILPYMITERKSHLIPEERSCY